MIDLFDIKDVNKAASAVNPDKLVWINQQYIKSNYAGLPAVLETYLTSLGIDSGTGPGLDDLIEVQKDRCKDMLEMAEQSRYFFEDFEDFDDAAARKRLRPVVLEPLSKLKQHLAELPDWENETIHAAVTDIASDFDLKMGKIAQPLRVAVTGSSVSPSIDDTVRLIGRERTLARLDKALNYIKDRQSSA